MILLAIDDDEGTLALVRAALRQEGLEIHTAADPLDGLAMVKAIRPQIVLLDIAMPNLNGMEVLKQIIERDPETAVIMMTAHYSTESAVTAIQMGATDYCEKPLDIDRLRKRVRVLLAEAISRDDARKLEIELARTLNFEGLVGRSPVMLDALSKIRRVAPHFRTLLLSGATGTGKELAAKALHRLSPAGERPFTVCNCAALPEELIESELFGYVKGAFTGANKDKPGLFEAANGSTLFLDEIGELPLPSQAKLLRALQNQEIQPLGTTAARKVNVRIICATNRDLRSLVAEKGFREDLFFRLCMIEIHLPRLLERREDLPLLTRHFIASFSRIYEKAVEGITRRAETLLSRYAWPGNIRELENVIGYACMMTDSSLIDIHHLPDIFRPQPSQINHSIDLVSLDEIQRIHTRRILEYFEGDKVRTVELLQCSRSTLYRLLAGGNEQKEAEASAV